MVSFNSKWVIGIIAVVVVIAALFGGGYHFGYLAKSNEANEALIQAVAEKQKREKELQAEVAEIGKEAQEKADASALAYKKGITDAETKYNNLLSKFNDPNNGMSIEVELGPNDATCSKDETNLGQLRTGSYRPSRAVREFLAGEAHAAQRTAEQHNQLLKDKRIIEYKLEMYEKLYGTL